MEQDRYEQNKVLFIIGMISMITSLSLFVFAFYILPMLIWNWGYDVPDFIFMWRENLRQSYSYSEAWAGFILFLIILIPAFITGVISHLISNTIDNQIHGIVKEKKEGNKINVPEHVKESLGFSVKLIIILVLVVMALWFVEWLVAVPTFE